MKSEFSAIELRHLLEEIKGVENSKVDKIYQPSLDEVLLQLYKTGGGKAIIRISGKLMYLTEHKSESPQNPFGFCTYLRKKLSNSILKSISQVGSERIVELIFETRERKLKLVIELFGTGNMILVDEKGIIMSPMNIQKFKEREVKPGDIYTYPKKEYSLFELTESGFTQALKKTAAESVVRFLALDLSIGGTYSEEICLLAGIDKNKKPSSFSDKESKSLYSSLKDILSRKPKPAIVRKGEEVVDIIPFELRTYVEKGLEMQPAESYNKALDSVITVHVASKKSEENEKVRSKELERLRKSIEAQVKSIQKQHKDSDENQRKGELIYENYAVVKDVIDEINRARQKYSFKEIKEKLKGHKTVKEINEKEGKVVIEIG